MRPLRVLHLVHNIDHGGMERMIAELARRTDRAAFDVHILALGYLGHFGPEAAASASVAVARPMSRLSLLRPTSLAEEIRAIAPDVAHIHSGVWYKSIRASSLARVPVRIYTDHGRQLPDPLLYRMIDRRASRKTHHIVAVSGALAVHMAKFVAYPERISVIPNGVDTTRFSPDRAERRSLLSELGLVQQTPLIGSTGRFDAIKGYDVLLRAFALLLKEWREPVRPALALVGDGPEDGTLRSLASDLGISSDVHFLGWRGDIERIVSSFDVFTMASHSEGTSVSLLEAMSAGACPVVTDVGGNSAVLGKVLEHRLVPPAAPPALAAALSRALRDEIARRDDAARARARIVAEFSLDGTVRAYEALYRRAVDSTAA